MLLPQYFFDDNQGSLARQVGLLQNTHDQAKERVIRLVPDGFRDELGKMSVVVAPNPDEEAESVDGQYNLLSGRIVCFVPRQLPQSNGHEAAFRREYADTLGHEVCHGLRSRYARLETLGDAIVHEGIAMHFGRLAKGHPTPCIEEYEDTPIGEMLSDVGPEIRSGNFSYQEWFIGSGDGYRIGEAVVGFYLANRNRQVGQVLDVPAASIIGYAENHASGNERYRESIRNILKYGYF